MLSALLVSLNLLVFSYQVRLFVHNPKNIRPTVDFINHWGLVPADLIHHRYVGVVTHMFLHGGVSHILGNMICLWAFACSLEVGFGAMYLLGFYIFWGVAGAIILRIVLTAFAAALLTLPWLKLLGGLALLWIGIKLLMPEEEGGHEIKGSTNLWGAVRTVIVADFVMSLDNVIGVAGAAKGNVPLLIFGLVVSIPLVVLGSQLILKLIERWPLVVVAGGALLGWIAGELIWTDPALAGYTAGMPEYLKYVAAAVGAMLVVVLARILAARARRAPPSPTG